MERPLVFPDNDRPGIMLAESARALATRYGARPGARVVVATVHDWAYRAALDLAAADVEIAMIADLRPRAEGQWPEAARRAGLRVETDATILGAYGVARVTHAIVARRGGEATPIACDCLAMSGGWTANVALHAQARGKLAFDEATQSFLPVEPAAGVSSAGACRGLFGLDEALADGAAAGAEAAGAEAPQPARAAGVAKAGGGSLGLVIAGADRQPAKAFVDFHNDVSARDIALAAREGMRSIEHIKRYTTTGMGADQGKATNLNALAIAAAGARQVDPRGRADDLPPALCAGDFRRARRPRARRSVRSDPREPLHGWSARRGAVFEEAGLWKRASRFPRAGESARETLQRECLTTRASVGIQDASTLGKIEVVGPDAAEFLERLYVNAFAKLGVGRCRYAMMLGEDGYVDRRRRRHAARRRPLPCHDDDRRGRARLGADGGLSPDRMARSQGLADLDHRAMGDDRDQRPECAQAHRAAGRGRSTSRPPRSRI